MGRKNDLIYPSSGPKVNNVSRPLEQGASYMPTFFYNYPGPAGMFGQADDQGHLNASGAYMPDSSSPLYYPHGYIPYTTGFYDPTYSGDGSSASYGSLNPVTMGSSGSNTDTSLSNKAQALPYNSMVHSQWANLNEPMYHNLPSNSLNKGYSPTPNVYGPATYYQPNGRLWNDNNYKHKAHQTFGRNKKAVEGLTELARGPRAERKKSLTNGKDSEQPFAAIQRYACNLKEFKIEYDNAKFFVIKSFSEDDVQRSLKYNVWSSTPNGNMKLDASFQEAEAIASETRQECPIFLFFSVNGSGQFIGVAQMMGKVDFTKNMDFWQQDKWSGFFPVKWHIIKDVPNRNLKHIILENNENKAVTHSRDTQEIGLKQGLEMLSIFKNYSEEASLLNDFDFYEKRAKELKAKRTPKTASSEANGFGISTHEKRREASASEGMNLEGYAAADTTDCFSTLVSLSNLSLDS